MILESVHHISTMDGEQIAIWQIYNPAHKNQSFAKPIPTKNVLLLHGAFSDKRACLGLAGYLAKLGYNCFIMVWRGRGHSSIPKNKFNFETIAHQDVAATFNHLFNELKINNLHCVTHSGGGICLTMFLAKNKHYIKLINSITLIACQVYGAASNAKSYSKIIALRGVTRVLGHLPAKTFNMGPFNESHYTMKQWYNWNLKHNFYSDTYLKNGAPISSNPIKIKYGNLQMFDYRHNMNDITTPIYAISAKGDDFIAPSKACKQFLDDFNNAANQFREFSTENGDLEDYDHTHILMSLNAAREIWPSIANWIDKNSS